MTSRFTPSEQWEILIEALGALGGPGEICARRGISMTTLRAWLRVARAGAIAHLTEHLNLEIREAETSKRPSGRPTSRTDSGLILGGAALNTLSDAPSTVIKEERCQGLERPHDSVPPLLEAEGALTSNEATGKMCTDLPPGGEGELRPPPGLVASDPIDHSPLPVAPPSRDSTAEWEVNPKVAGALRLRKPSMPPLGPPVPREPSQRRGASETHSQPPPVDTDIAEPLVGFSSEDVDALFSLLTHEMREPLRGQAAMVQFIQDDFGAELPAPLMAHLATLENCNTRLRAMLDGLSAYVHCLDRLRPFRPVDLGGILAQVRAELYPFLEQRRGRIVIDSSLPIVCGDADGLAVAFRQILENGLKFNRRPNPEVEVTAGPSVSPLEREIRVRDNGIGVETRHWNSVFDLFVRLNRYEEYPGAGVGLSIARRILQAHGGTLQVGESSDSGLVLLVRLPQGQEP